MITSQILDICTDGAHKTQIVYQANLNFRTVNPYIEFLTNIDMIDVNEDNNLVIYKTTEKGLRLLDNYRNIQDMLAPKQKKKVVNSQNDLEECVNS